eukprot:scaffold1809_cov228-Pinguiococcus_pyrenoidosus.AAC.20
MSKGLWRQCWNRREKHRISRQQRSRFAGGGGAGSAAARCGTAGGTLVPFAAAAGSAARWKPSVSASLRCKRAPHDAAGAISMARIHEDAGGWGQRSLAGAAREGCGAVRCGCWLMCAEGC